jgi:putative aminopeptidase FrvX
MDNSQGAPGTKVAKCASRAVSSPVLFARLILSPAVVGASLLSGSCLAQTPPGTSGPAASAVVLQATEQTNTTEVVDLAKVLASARESATTVSSLFLSQRQRVESVEAFVKIVGIKSPSDEEGAVREALRRMLGSLKAGEINCTPAGTNVPLNLVMEFPATRDFQDQPAVILNAHMDTISAQRGYAPEQMDFDVQTREFFHRKQGSFGADDKAGVAVILSALGKLKSDYWDKGVGHRRILVIYTAHEEGGCVGATYLGKRYPKLFDKVELSLTSDGPLNYDNPSLYPENSFVVVVGQETSHAPPYSRIIEYVQDLCALKKVTFAKTRNGLGQGDFARFPPQAHAELHLRSPYQNNHRRERVKLDDLFNHIELFAYILLRLDGASVQLNQR